MAHRYTCANCGGSFVSDWSEADALLEYQETFTEEERSRDADPPLSICDDCYQKALRLEQASGKCLECGEACPGTSPTDSVLCGRCVAKIAGI